MTLKEFMNNNILVLDGGMGTLLQKKGLKPGELPETWNITHPDIIQKIHTDYYDSGSNVVSTNTFGANLLKFSEDELDKIIQAAINNAKIAKNNSISIQNKFIALDIGPCGRLLKPFGDFDFEDAVSLFAYTVKLGVKYGVDLIFIETMNDSYETKAAILAAKENCDLPIFVSNAYSDNGKLMTGATPEAMVALAEGMGVDAIGTNCSLGPKQLAPIISRLLERSSIPVLLKPNAGLPKSVNNETVFDVSPYEFAEEVADQLKKGVCIVGGCCGTTPEYIKKLATLSKGINFIKPSNKNFTCVSSYSHAVDFTNKPVLIGERINPTGKKRFKQALKENDINYILREGLEQQEKGVHILDVNVGLPEIDEVEMLKDVVCELQAVSNLPLQLDTSNPNAMEKGLRYYNGKALINSVNGKQESMATIFPLVKKYGGVVVALTLDENGIPETAEGRVEVANKIIATAKKYGIDKKDIVFDTLAMTISADKNAAITTLKALNIIKNKFGCHTSLGISNVSFGLPSRPSINSGFFAAALENGLSSAILNPHSTEMMKTYYAFCAIHGMDDNCADYINFMSTVKETVIESVTNVAISSDNKGESELKNAIVKGLKDEAKSITSMLLKTKNPLEIVQDEIVPALDIVGKGFENKTVYLPQLLMSAESAQYSFEQIKTVMINDKNDLKNKCEFVIATVQGDIHDIGKNIVKLLLENYGFNVIDLGKDVPPEKIVDTVIKHHAPIVGLSALMTTTVPAMEETIKLIKEKAPWCKTVVGGAVLTQEYANNICADKYAKDAMETVRYAEKIAKVVK